MFSFLISLFLTSANFFNVVIKQVSLKDITTLNSNYINKLQTRVRNETKLDQANLVVAKICAYQSWRRVLIILDMFMTDYIGLSNIQCDLLSKKVN